MRRGKGIECREKVVRIFQRNRFTVVEHISSSWVAGVKADNGAMWGSRIVTTYSISRSKSGAGHDDLTETLTGGECVIESNVPSEEARTQATRRVAVANNEKVGASMASACSGSFRPA